MSALDDKFRPLATKLIAKYGTAITLNAVTAGAYNPAIGSTSNSAASVDTKAVIRAYTTSKDGAGIAAGLILVGDMEFVVAAEGITKPKPGDTVTLYGVVYSVITCAEIWSGEQVAAYEIQGRT